MRSTNEPILIRDLTSMDLHELDPSTPCLIEEHDGLSSTPTWYTAGEGVARPGKQKTLPLSSFKPHQHPYIWNAETQTYWVSRVMPALTPPYKYWQGWHGECYTKSA